MDRLIEEINGVPTLRDGAQATAAQTLARLYALTDALRAELCAGERRMRALRDAGREKSAEYRQLFAGRLQLLFMLRRLEDAGLAQTNNNE